MPRKDKTNNPIKLKEATTAFPEKGETKISTPIALGTDIINVADHHQRWAYRPVRLPTRLINAMPKNIIPESKREKPLVLVNCFDTKKREPIKLIPKKKKKTQLWQKCLNIRINRLLRHAWKLNTI